MSKLFVATDPDSLVEVIELEKMIKDEGFAKAICYKTVKYHISNVDATLVKAAYGVYDIDAASRNTR